MVPVEAVTVREATERTQQQERQTPEAGVEVVVLPQGASAAVEMVVPVPSTSGTRSKGTDMGLNQRRPTLFGRAIKPFMMLLTLTMIIVAQSNLRGIDRGVEPPLSVFLGVIAVCAAVCLIVGWVSQRKMVLEHGLLAVVFVCLTRAVFIQMSSVWDQAVFFSLAVVASAGAAYFMEVAERHYDRHRGVIAKGVL